MNKLTILALTLLMLTGCGDKDEADGTTTKLNMVEIEPGTISDSMIILDDAASDGAEAEAEGESEGGTASGAATAPGAEAAPGDAEGDGAADASEEGDTIIAPGGARKAATPAN